MTAVKLTPTALATLRDHGVSPALWARANYSADGVWRGDVCGCPDSGRCANGYHHMRKDDCRCLPALLESFLKGEGYFAEPAPALPFTWAAFEREIGKPLPDEAKTRITRLVRNPTAETWAAARSIVVAPHLSIMGQTLWQCVEAVTLQEHPDGRAPDQGTVILALCYAAGIPRPAEGKGLTMTEYVNDAATERELGRLADNTQTTIARLEEALTAARQVRDAAMAAKSRPPLRDSGLGEITAGHQLMLSALEFARAHGDLTTGIISKIPARWEAGGGGTR